MLRRKHFYLLVLATCIASVPVCAQDSQERSAVCRFDDESALTIRYTVPQKGDNPKMGSVWAPGGKPMSLLTETPLKIGSATLPTGGYNLYLLPNKPKWELIVNKNVSSKEYDSSGDVVRIPLDSGKLPTPVTELSVAMGHVGPKQCNFRVYFEKTGMFTELYQQ